MNALTRITRMRGGAEVCGQKHWTEVRGIAARLAAVGLFGALGLAGLTPAKARAQAPGQSFSSASVNDYLHSVYHCYNTSGVTATTSESCPATAIANVTGTSATTSSNAARTATASAAVTKTSGPGPSYVFSDGDSHQVSALTVTGTPSAGDQLVFHFVTSQSAMGSGGATAEAGYGFWALYLNGASGAATASQFTYSDGTQSGYHSNATQTAAGFDMTLPFSAGSTFGFVFEARATGFIYTQPLPDGTTFSGSISAMLQGVDAQTGSGMFLSSAAFDDQTGLGTISATATSTVPEPSSLALLGTGVVGLISVMRRRVS